MEARALVQTVRNNQEQWLRVTFTKNNDGITALTRLRRAYCGENKTVTIDNIDDLTGAAVCLSRNWDGDRNRTIKFKGLETLDDSILAQFARDIERITA